MMRYFLNFSKMQVSSLSRIVWLQLLCIALYPMFFTQINASNDFANTFTYTLGLVMFSYLIMRNFAFNDARYKTKLLFCILSVTPKVIIGSRVVIVYLFCFIATPLIILFSNIIHLIKPEMFAAVSIHILPDGLLLAAVFLPIEFLIFYLFEAQRADIIAALVPFLYMGLIFLMYKYLRGPLWIIVWILAVFMNVSCYFASQKLYQSN